ncbi:uncharacterized protein cubi_03051 [Cryptosporidium ubiquitum]|uniref:Uncharacterized protein n=1 Tax=Cryptosporidium ubiquitum TaxID=857276 RepID=A0A1J4ML32_9CRYT|nr:uncharacterized protein cubi_03051 [Cryptosporidium ubiquitum]OII74920.1 hypothetical protein cubi_03051 [Cryptosporidium ubiquitum]
MNHTEIFKSKNIYFCLILITTFIGYIFCSGYYNDDVISFDKARLIFSRDAMNFGAYNNPEIWKLADREINSLKQESKLPIIYQNSGGRNLFVSVEILQACERLLNRIELDPLTPQIIDNDLSIFNSGTKISFQDLGARVAREIQYCFLQYGSDVLEIPALENYVEKLKIWGINQIFKDEAAKKSLEDVKQKVRTEGKKSSDKFTQLNLVTSDSGEKEKYLIARRSKPEKRKLVTIDRKKITKKNENPREVELEHKEQKRIIARPKKDIRQITHGETKANYGFLGNQALASTKKAGVDLIKLINQDEISEKLRILGPEARLILAWQSVVEAQNEFNEESDYLVKNLPKVVDSSVLYQSCPNFSLLNFKNECVEFIMFRNSQITKGFLDGEPTLFFLKDGDILITSNHLVRTAAQELCSIAHESYLPEMIKNSESYLERIHTIQVQGQLETQDQETETSIKNPPSKSQNPKSRLFNLYKKIITKRGAVPYLNEKDLIWDSLLACNSGECINEIIYRDLSYWLIPPEYIQYIIFRIASESYADSLTILDFTVPTNSKIGNVIDPSGGKVVKICETYVQSLASSGKADLVVGGTHSDFDHLLQELCRDVELEVSKNESILSNKKLLIGTLYELELAFCGIMGVSPKGRSTEAYNSKSELELLSSGPVDFAKDVWAIEECGIVSQSQLNYLLCFGSFSQGFISHIFPNSIESVIPITLLCRTLLNMEKDAKNPYDPHDFGTYLSNALFEENLHELFPFSKENTKKAKKTTLSFFIELTNQFIMNLEKNMYINPKNTIDSIESIYSIRICSAPLFAFLPFDINIFPINEKLVNTLVQYGCRANINAILSPGNLQPCIGLQQNIINYLHVLAAVIELFTNHFIDPKKLGTNDIDIPVNSLCLWWKHPVNHPLNTVLVNKLPFMKNSEVSEYVLRYSLMMESMNFPGPVKAEKRIEYIYSNPQIYSNRAKDLPKNIIYPDFNPPNNVFDALEYYLRMDVIIGYRQLQRELDDKPIEQITYEFVSKKCPTLESWQIYLAIAFQNSVKTVMKMILPKLNEPNQFKIEIDILCRWILQNFPKDFNTDKFVDVIDAGESLETEAKQSIPWLQPSVGAYLLSTFNVWSQTEYVLKIGGISKAKKLDRNKIKLDEFKFLFEKKAIPVINSNQEPKILSLDSLSPITRLKLNPFVDETLSLPNPTLESECDNLWVANLMNAFRIYFMEFQRKFIDPIFHGFFDPIIMCEIVKEIVKKKVFQFGFGDVFYRVFKDKKWIKNKQLVRVLVKNAGDWILQTFELPSYPTYDIIQCNKNLIECHKLSYSMENRPISSSLRLKIDEIEEELLPRLEITTFPSLSLKSIIPFLRSTDPITYYGNVENCAKLLEFEVRMLVSLSSYLETISKSIFNSEVPQESTKKGLLEELKFEFPLDAMCNWWTSTKVTKASPNYSDSGVSWASLLSKHIIHFHFEKFKSNPEMVMEWKPWFTAPVAEALLFGFFNSINNNTKNRYKIINMNDIQGGFINQSQIRRLEVLETIFNTNDNYKFASSFHRSINDLNSMPLSYFSYLHLPSEHYEKIMNFVREEYKRPIGHSDIMIGRVSHQIEINMCTFIAYSISKHSELAKGNNWKITANNVLEAFNQYKSSDLSLKSWLKNLQLSIPNVNLSIQSVFILFTKYLKEEAKLIRTNLSENNFRSEYWGQVDSFYSLPLHANMKFNPSPPFGYFPIFQIDQNLDFKTVKIPNLGQNKPVPLMKFSRFRGRYWRSKMHINGKQSFLDDVPETIPSIWPSIGKVAEFKKDTDEQYENPKLDYIAIISELEVKSKFNCDGLFVWQVNRAAYWAGMLQRYIIKGPRLLKDNKELLKKISSIWSIKIKSRKLPKVTNTDKRNRSFNIFDMFFFYKVLNFFYNDLKGIGNNQKITASWEDELEKLPFFTINLFNQLFIQEYRNLNYEHIVFFFYEMLLEEKRIIKLKTRSDGIFITEKDRLKAIYHAPLFPEPKEYIYPGMFFELEPPLPCSWDKVKVIDSTIIPVVSINSDDLVSHTNAIYLYGQPRSDIQLREVNEIKSKFSELTKNGVFLELFDIGYLESLTSMTKDIILKKLPLAGFNWLIQTKNKQNSGISSKSIYWDQISKTFTNGLDWFIEHSALASESTFISSINIVETITQVLSRELKVIPNYTEYFQDPSILPNIFLSFPTLSILSRGNAEMSKNLYNLCLQYLSGVSPISIMNKELLSFYGNSDGKNYSEYICNQVTNIWEPNLPFLLKQIRKIFLMEFIRRIKQEDARSGNKLIWPSTSTSLITADWQLLSEKSDNGEPIKSNNFVGFYNFHYFWDPALLLNAFYSESEVSNIYFEEEFTNNVVLEMSQTPLIELGSWISNAHSPLYSKNKLITYNTINHLLISQISSKKAIDLKKVESIKINEDDISTLYKYCFNWVSQTLIFSKEEKITFCNELEKKYGKTMIYIYSQSHQFEMIFNSLQLLVERHPISDYTNHLNMERSIKTDIEKLFNDAIFNSEIPQTIRVRALNNNIDTYVYIDPNIANYSFLQFAPLEMHKDLQNKNLLIYSKRLFLNDYVINRAFEETMSFLQLKTTAFVKLNIDENTSLSDLESMCIHWTDLHTNEIIVLKPNVDKLFEYSIPVVEYPEGIIGIVTINTINGNRKDVIKTICETFIDLISVNHLLFSSEKKNNIYSKFINDISKNYKTNLNEKIIGWHTISGIVSSWAKEYSLIIGPRIFSHLITKISVKSLNQLEKYSLSDFYHDTGINQMMFFFNYESFIRMIIDSAYEIGYLLITIKTPDKDLVPSGKQRIKISEIVLYCAELIPVLISENYISLKKIGNRLDDKSQAIDIKKVSIDTCEHMAKNNKRMLRNFAESKSSRNRAIKDLYNRIRSINREVGSTSFAFIYK